MKKLVFMILVILSFVSCISEDSDNVTILLDAPDNFRAFNVTENGFLLLWDPIDSSSSNVNFSNISYIVKQYDSAKKLLNTYEMPDNISQKDFSNLAPNTIFFFKIATKNSNGVGPYSNFLEVATNPLSGGNLPVEITE